jgi:heat-inducible transcriptional repressor
MIDLVARQIQVLRAIIEEFIETAEPVGSETIDKKYNIGVSPATIRNEMVYLTKQGYLQKSHVSAGRVPTPLALRLYVNELMKEQELSVADEVSAKEKIWEHRGEIEDLLYEATKVLAKKAKALGVAMAQGPRLFHSGYANLLNMPEFFDIRVTRNVLSLIEKEAMMREVFGLGQSENPVHLVYGKDLGNKDLEPVSVIYTEINAGGKLYKLGVLGSHRFDYSYVIPMMKYFKALIEEIVEE